MTDAVDVVIVGAGAAGLAAGRALRTQGLRAIIVEASGRIGGRAWTTHPPELGGVWFDMGALWLHAAERNPLVADRSGRQRDIAERRRPAERPHLRWFPYGNPSRGGRL